MSSKQSHKNTMSKTSHQKRTARARAASMKRAHATSSRVGRTTTSETTTAAERDPRLPAIGTVIRKLDRHGKVRCKCRVVRDGIQYKGRVYRSLSGSAVAAATDLGLESPTQNGYVFWDLQPTADA